MGVQAQVEDRPAHIDQPYGDDEPQLSAARAEADEAYTAARHLVYDQLPVGPVNSESLSHDQVQALARLDAAEERLKELRRG